MARGTPRWWVFLLSAAFLGYFALLVYCDVRRPENYGFEADFTTGRMRLTRVASEPPASPAARAGLVARRSDCRGGRQADPKPRGLDDRRRDRGVRPSHSPARAPPTGRSLQVALTLAPAPWSYWKTEPGVILLGVLGLQLVALAFGVLIVVQTPGRSRRRCWAPGRWRLWRVYTIVPPIASAPCGGICPAVARRADVGAVHQQPRSRRRPVHVLRELSAPHGAFSPGLGGACGRRWPLALVLPVRDAMLMVYRGSARAGVGTPGAVVDGATAAYTVAGLSALVFNYQAPHRSERTATGESARHRGGGRAAAWPARRRLVPVAVARQSRAVDLRVQGDVVRDAHGACSSRPHSPTPSCATGSSTSG